MSSPFLYDELSQQETTSGTSRSPPRSSSTSFLTSMGTLGISVISMMTAVVAIAALVLGILAVAKAPYNASLNSHTFLMQPADAYAFPYVTQPALPLTVQIRSDSSHQVDLQLPTFTFTIPEDVSSLDYLGGTGFSTGFMETIAQPLPMAYRPKDVVSGVFSVLSTPPFTYASVEDGYPPLPLLSVTVAIDIYGQLMILGNTNANQDIPAGTYTLDGGTLSYSTLPTGGYFTAHTEVVQTAASDITSFTARNLNDGYRDSHVMGISAGHKIAVTWTSNQEQTDKTNGVLNMYLSLGTLDPKGVATLTTPIQLSAITSGAMAWDSAVAFQATNPQVIMASWGQLGRTDPRCNVAGTWETYCVNQPIARFSIDGGQTWSPPLSVNSNVTAIGDARGVLAHPHGQFFYSYTSVGVGGAPINVFHSVWTDPATPWKVIQQTTDSAINQTTNATSGVYDYPQFAASPTGVWWVAQFFSLPSGDNTYRLGFIPVTGPGVGGLPSLADPSLNTVILLDTWVNSLSVATIVATSTNDVFIQASTNLAYMGANILIYKFPAGSTTSAELLGPYPMSTLTHNWFMPVLSYPVAGYTYFPITANSMVYDNTRHVLFAAYTEMVSAASQDYALLMRLSCTEGQTWSRPVDWAGTLLNNRGFSSIALDPSTGALHMSFMDGRNDPQGVKMQPMHAWFTADEVNTLVSTLCTETAGTAPLPYVDTGVNHLTVAWILQKIQQSVVSPNPPRVYRHPGREGLTSRDVARANARARAHMRLGVHLHEDL